MSPQVQSLHALLLLIGLPSGSGTVQIGLSLSSGFNNDLPPSGKSGESSAHKALRFALSVAVPVRLFKFKGRAAGLLVVPPGVVVVEPDSDPEAGVETGTGAETVEVEGEV